MDKAKARISLISKLNYFRLFFRSILFATVAVLYVISRIKWPDATLTLGTMGGSTQRFLLLNNVYVHYSVLGTITVYYFIEMVDRFFPTKTASMGSQKQFKRNYIPTGEEKPHLQPWYRTALVFISWVLLNGLFALVYILCKTDVIPIRIFDEGIMMIIALAYGICDMICILFFCPFQTWMMRNRCCGSCRIYNWDFMMIATPLIVVTFLPFTKDMSIFAIIFVACATILLLRWEITFRIHPRRFAINTNESLHCVNCKEKLCVHKKQLQTLLRKSGSWMLKTLKETKTKDDIYRKDQALGGRKELKHPNDNLPPEHHQHSA